MNTSFEKCKNTTVEWYTPPEIIHSLGKFDLDPCTSIEAMDINNSAEAFYTKDEDGLSKEWTGRVWLNPPYQNPDIKLFMRKMAGHNNGIALVSTRCDSSWFQDYVLTRADSILFLRKRIKFIRPDGTKGDSPGVGSTLVAYGIENTKALAQCGFDGILVELNNHKKITQYGKD